MTPLPSMYPRQKSGFAWWDSGLVSVFFLLTSSLLNGRQVALLVITADYPEKSETCHDLSRSLDHLRVTLLPFPT